MKNPVSKTILGGLLAATLVLAQTPAPAAAPVAKGRPGVGRLVRQLNLTPDQKTQAKAIFEAGRTDAKPVAFQLKQAREALANAVKSGAPDAQIDQLSTAVGPLASQLAAIRAKTLAKFYAILTPDQKDKASAIMSQARAGNLRPAAFRHGAGRRSAPAVEQQ